MQPTQTNQQHNQPDMPQKPPEPEYRFRWPVFLGVPIVALAFFWVLNGLEASFKFEDIMNALGVVQQQKYARMGCLATLLIAVTLIIKTLKNHSD